MPTLAISVEVETGKVTKPVQAYVVTINSTIPCINTAELIYPDNSKDSKVC